jgi:ATP-dependent protease HslVU (ClpYQ) peptidase subunit
MHDYGDNYALGANDELGERAQTSLELTVIVDKLLNIAHNLCKTLVGIGRHISQVRTLVVHSRW